MQRRLAARGRQVHAAHQRTLLAAHGSAVLVIALWSGTYIFTKAALTEVGPIALAFYRNLLGSAALVAWFVATRPPALLPQRRDYPLLVGLGLCGIGLFYVLQNVGLHYTTATDTALLVTTSPAMISILAIAVLGERMTRRKSAGIVLAMAGVLVLATVGTAGSHGGATVGQRVFGDALIVLTALGWAVYTVYGKGLLDRYSAIGLTTYTTVLGTAALFPFTVLESWGRPAQLPSLSLIGAVLYLGILGSAVGYVLWNHALRSLPAGTVGTYLYVRPLLTAVLAAVALGEQPSVLTALSGVLIVAGAALCLSKAAP